MTVAPPNAIILAAGTSSRFVPLSAEIPKGLLEVKGEILVERQIRQLLEAGIDDITVVTGYKAEMFDYLRDKFGVRTVFNEEFDCCNNTSSMVRVADILGDTYICSSDNYFPQNVFAQNAFKENPSHSFYSALYAEGETSEYCLSTDADGFITTVKVGGKDSWYMVGHVYFSSDFSRAFAPLLRREYEKEETRQGYWEDLYIRHIEDLPKMKINRYSPGEIEEFDTLDELRLFDPSYLYHTHSSVIRSIASELGCPESALSGFRRLPAPKNNTSRPLCFTFLKDGATYKFEETTCKITLL